MQLNVSELLKSFDKSINDYNYIVLKGRSISDSNSINDINFLTLDGKNYGPNVELKKNWQEIRIPITSFKASSSLILPFSYPHFLTKIWNPDEKNESKEINLKNLNFMQIICPQAVNAKSETGFEIESIILEKK